MAEPLDIDKLLRGAPAPNTEKAYSGDVRYFWAWAKIALGMDEGYPVDPSVVERFVEQHIVGLKPNVEKYLIDAGVKKGPGRLKVDTLKRKVNALVKWHTMEGFENNFRTTHLKAIFLASKRYETQQGVTQKQAKAVTVRTLNQMLKTFRGDHSLSDIRDMAMLVFAFYTGGRRSAEVREAMFDHLYPFPGGFKYHLYRSKTDQLGTGAEKILRNPHADFLRKWIRAGQIDGGYLFRSISRGEITDKPIGKNAFSTLVKERVEMIGLNPRQYSGHSIRRGFITQCGMDGISLGEAMQCSGHKHVIQAMKYHEQGAMDQNSATRINTRNRKKSGNCETASSRDGKGK